MIKELKNDFLSISFDSEKGRIVSMVNLLSGDEYIKKENTAEIFELTCINHKNQLSKVYPTEVKVVEIVEEASKKILKVEYTLDVNFDVVTKITLGNRSNILIWDIEIVNNSSRYDVVEVLYPRVRGIYLGDTWEDDIIIFPHHAGEKTLNPFEEYKKPAFKDMERAGVKEDGNINYREINYCGLASMTWMYYYDKSNGFYISSCDDDFPVTALRFESSGDLSPWVGFAIRKYIRIRKNEKWISKPYEIGINCEDWHWGAKTYRKWIDRYIRMPENPEYLRDECVLMNMYKFRREGQVYYTFNDIPYLYDFGKNFGINHFFMAGWNRWGFDQHYPEYYPDLQLGTSMDLYKGCEYINDHEGIPTFYINARIFDKKSDYFDTLGKTMAIKNYSGEMIYEKYGEYEFTLSCPSDELWQKYITDAALWMVKAYNAKGIYLDQVGSAEPYACYDFNHSHKDIGEFSKGYLKILKDVKSEINKLNKDTFLMIENCGDIYGSYVWGNLTWNWEVRDEFFNLYKYTFPEYVQVNMINPKMIEDRKKREEIFYKDVERAILIGSVLWVNPLVKFNIYDEEDAKLLEYLKKAITLRKKLNNYIKECRFVDTDGITYISQKINITHWIGEKFDVYIIGNNDLQEGYFEIEKGKDISVLYTIDGEKLINTIDDLRIQVPVSRIAFMVFEK